MHQGPDGLLARTDGFGRGRVRQHTVKEARSRSRTRKTKALRGLSNLKTVCNAKDKFVSRRMTIKRVASLLSTKKKWKRPYSETCAYVRSRISISLVSAASHCLRGSRDPASRVSHAAWEMGTGMSL